MSVPVNQPRIAIVGPCSSGKSTLRQNLHTAGYNHIRNPAQEHSYVPHMWQKLTQPDILIYLDVDYPTTLARRPHQDLGSQRLEQQKQRLSHARTHAHFYLDTSRLTPTQIADKVLAFLAQHQ